MIINIAKVSGIILNKKKCPICNNKLTEEHLKEQKYTCRVACNHCRIVHDDYYFYNCYDSFITSVVNRLKAKIAKVKKANTY